MEKKKTLKCQNILQNCKVQENTFQILLYIYIFKQNIFLNFKLYFYCAVYNIYLNFSQTKYVAIFFILFLYIG